MHRRDPGQPNRRGSTSNAKPSSADLISAEARDSAPVKKLEPYIATMCH